MLTEPNIRLLSIGGDIRDPSQGVYADIVTNENPSLFKIYVGSAAASSVPLSRKPKGLRRRIQEHMSYARSKTRSPQSGQPHCNEIREKGSHCNFVVLVQFAEQVKKPLVHIAEAVMTILFASWDSQSFSSLRPVCLPRGPYCGLNNANPLDYGVSSCVSLRAGQIRTENGRRKAQKMREASIAKAKEGGPFLVTTQQISPSYWDFRVKICGANIKIPSELGLSVGLHIRRTLNIQCETDTPQQHHPYAAKAKWDESARRLGICLKRQPCMWSPKRRNIHEMGSMQFS